MPTRDLVGYGGTEPEITWPNGARLAVSLVVNFEEGAEQQVGDGDTATERIGEVVSVVAPACATSARSRSSPTACARGCGASWMPWSAGGFPPRSSVCGRAVERVPDACRGVRGAATSRPATAGAGGRTRTIASREEEARRPRPLHRRRSQGATGVRPVGFFCRGSESLWTRDLLAERGFLYTSNAFDDDLPYWDRGVRGRRCSSCLTRSTRNDMKFFHPNGFVRAARNGRATSRTRSTCCLPRPTAARAACSIWASICASAAGRRVFRQRSRSWTSCEGSAPEPGSRGASTSPSTR